MLRVRNSSLHSVPCVSARASASVHSHRLAAGLHRTVGSADRSAWMDEEVLMSLEGTQLADLERTASEVRGGFGSSLLMFLRQAQPLPLSLHLSPCNSDAGSFIHPLLYSGRGWRLEERVWAGPGLSFVLRLVYFTLWIQSIYHLTKPKWRWVG